MYNYSPNRHFGDHDMEGTEFSLFINKTFAQLSLSQAVEEIVCISSTKFTSILFYRLREKNLLMSF